MNFVCFFKKALICFSFSFSYTFYVFLFQLNLYSSFKNFYYDFYLLLISLLLCQYSFYSFLVSLVHQLHSLNQFMCFKMLWSHLVVCYKKLVLGWLLQCSHPTGRNPPPVIGWSSLHWPVQTQTYDGYM